MIYDGMILYIDTPGHDVKTLAMEGACAVAPMPQSPDHLESIVDRLAGQVHGFCAPSGGRQTVNRAGRLDRAEQLSRPNVLPCEEEWVPLVTQDPISHGGIPISSLAHV